MYLFTAAVAARGAPRQRGNSGVVRRYEREGIAGRGQEVVLSAELLAPSGTLSTQHSALCDCFPQCLGRDPRRFQIPVDGREDCAICGTNLDAADAEHEANVMEMRRLAQELRKALAGRN